MNKKMLYCATFIALVGFFGGFSFHAVAGNYVTGSTTTTDILLNSTANWEVIRSVTIIIPSEDTKSHGCVANASADVEAPTVLDENLQNRYIFVLTRNNSNPSTNTGSERTVELWDNDFDNDPKSLPVATTLHFNGVKSTNGKNGTGQHTFYFLGRKLGGYSTFVLDASMSVICVD